MDVTEALPKDRTEANRQAEQSTLNGLMSAMSFAGFARILPPPGYSLDPSNTELAFFVPDAAVVIWVQTPIIEYSAKGKILHSNIYVTFGVRGSGLTGKQLNLIREAIPSVTGGRLRVQGHKVHLPPDEERFLHLFDSYELWLDQRRPLGIDEWAEAVRAVYDHLRCGLPPLSKRIGYLDISRVCTTYKGQVYFPQECHESLGSLLGQAGAAEFLGAEVDDLKAVWDYHDFVDPDDEWGWEEESHGSDLGYDD